MRHGFKTFNTHIRSSNGGSSSGSSSSGSGGSESSRRSGSKDSSFSSNNWSRTHIYIKIITTPHLFSITQTNLFT